MISTKMEILDYIALETVNFSFDNADRVSTTGVSDSLSISRSLASQYLNELNKEGLIIKIRTRPVYFIHKKNYEKISNTSIRNNEYDSMDDLAVEVNKKRIFKTGFNRMIGNEGSLKQAINQILSSINYPPFGLSLLITGECGTGKKSLCQAVFEYCLENEIIRDKKLREVVCQKNDDFNSGFQALLTGTKSAKGLLETADRALLFIHNAEYLTEDNQYFLNDIVEKGYFSTDETDKRELKTQIVTVFNERNDLASNKDIFHSFAAQCVIPSLHDRYYQEKEELIIYFLKVESFKVKKNIMISENALLALANYNYPDNIRSMRKTIQAVCAKLNLENKDSGQICICYYQLPEDVIGVPKINLSQADDIGYIDVQNYRANNESETVVALFDSILNFLVNLDFQTLKDDLVINDFVNLIRGYSEQILFKRSVFNKKNQVLEQTMEKVINDTLGLFKVNIPINDILLIARIMYLDSYVDSSIKVWDKDNSWRINQINTLVERSFSDENFIVEKIQQLLRNSLEMVLNDICKIILTVNIHKYKKDLIKRNYLAVIIAHGNSTATSIADAVNSLLRTYIFDSINMPLDTSMKEIAERLRAYIERTTIKSDVIILVDMGSLEGIDHELSNILNRNVGIMNSVSTRMALEVGNGLLNNLNMEEILKKAQEYSNSTYKVVKNRNNRNVILFTSDNGLYMAEKLKSLFATSLPKALNVELMTIDYINVISKDYWDHLFETYNVLFVLGTFNPNVKNDKFVPIEDMINSITRIQGILSQFLKTDELNKFKDDLIRNFSLQNLVSFITILEPSKLIDFVVEATSLIQEKLGITFKNKTLIGIYIHISCLVERLVTKEEIDSHLNIADFEQHHQDFISIANESFLKIGRHYRVEIPISEIAYIYDYIKND